MLSRDSAAFSHCFPYINAVTGRYFASQLLNDYNLINLRLLGKFTGIFLLPSPIWMEGPSPPTVGSSHPLPVECMRGNSPTATDNGQVGWNRDRSKGWNRDRSRYKLVHCITSSHSITSCHVRLCN
jgi:hypothetical protein